MPIPTPTLPGQQAPDPEAERSWRRFWLQALPFTLLANAVIAGFLTVLTRDPFSSNLLYSNAIGLSILGLNFVGHLLFARRASAHWLITAASVPLGAAAGLAIVWTVKEGSLRERLASLPFVGTSVLVLGSAATWFFYARAKLALAAAAERSHALEREVQARRLAQAELKLLQAQIEPHFLFNTLSNVISLIDGDPPRARRMLLNLTSYLRGSLRRTREGDVTLGEELDLLRAYLEIQAVRMGPRLTWRIACPDDLREVTLPPLLLQPLVENAVRHGLEPRPQGGAVTVTAARAAGELVLEVRDDGMGLDPRRPAGVGLANVRRRVEAVSGGRGSLALVPQAAGGLCARICLPLGAPAPAPAAAPEASA